MEANTLMSIRKVKAQKGLEKSIVKRLGSLIKRIRESNQKTKIERLVHMIEPENAQERKF